MTMGTHYRNNNNTILYFTTTTDIYICSTIKQDLQTSGPHPHPYKLLLYTNKRSDMVMSYDKIDQTVLTNGGILFIANNRQNDSKYLSVISQTHIMYIWINSIQKYFINNYLISKYIIVNNSIVSILQAVGEGLHPSTGSASTSGLKSQLKLLLLNSATV